MTRAGRVARSRRETRVSGATEASRGVVASGATGASRAVALLIDVVSCIPDPTGKFSSD